jgi:hypothetical protein
MAIGAGVCVSVSANAATAPTHPAPSRRDSLRSPSAPSPPAKKKEGKETALVFKNAQAFQAVFPRETLRNAPGRGGTLQFCLECSQAFSSGIPSAFLIAGLARGHWEIFGRVIEYPCT